MTKTPIVRKETQFALLVSLQAISPELQLDYFAALAVIKHLPRRGQYNGFRLALLQCGWLGVHLLWLLHSSIDRPFWAPETTVANRAQVSRSMPR